MPFAYTVCSLSYVPFALSLGKSILKHNPRSKFFIGIVDRVAGRAVLPEIENISYIEVEEIGIAGFEEMCRRYTTFELVCACKPFFARHLFDTFHERETLLYFDVDILVFDSLAALEATLTKCNVLLTPHITKPLEPGDGTLFPNDENFTGVGIYNAGFFGLRHGDETFRFLDWWSERVRTKASMRLDKGYFVDQSWLSLVPLFFEGVHVETGPQYNAAYWNLHERTIDSADGEFTANGRPLVFFHFSGFRLQEPETMSSYQNRIVMSENPPLRELFDFYVKAVSVEIEKFPDVGDCLLTGGSVERKAARRQRLIEFIDRRLKF